MVRALHGAAVHADLLSPFGSDAKTRLGLSGDLILGLRCFDHIFVVFSLLRRAYQHLPAVNHDVYVRPFAVVGAFVITNNDRAVWSDDDS